MLIAVGVSCRFLYSSVSYLNVDYLVWRDRERERERERELFCCYRLLVVIWFVLGGVSSWCLG